MEETTNSKEKETKKKLENQDKKENVDISMDNKDSNELEQKESKSEDFNTPTNNAEILHLGENIHVSDIEITGCKRTDIEWLKKILSPLFNTRNFNDLQEIWNDIQKDIDKLQIFKHVNMNIHYKDFIPTHLILKLEFEEYSKLGYSLNFFSQDGHNLGIKINNLSGIGDLQTFSSQWEQFSSLPYPNTIHYDFSLPLIFSKKYLFSSSIFSQKHDFLLSSSYKSLFKGFSFQISDWNQRHTWQYQGIYRNIVPLIDQTNDRKASRSILLTSRPDVISALSYCINYNNIDNPLFPHSGLSLFWQHQIAGLGGENFFYKQHFSSYFYYPLSSYLTLGLHSQIGFYKSLASCHRLFSRYLPNIPSSLHDRFYLNSPLLIRGFDSRGIGNFDQQDNIGGDLLTVFGLNLSIKIPGFLENFRTRINTFLNCGNLLNFQSSTYSTLSSLVSTMRVSTGIGLVVPTPLGRIEINYSHVLRHQPNDLCKSGFSIQFDNLHS